MDFNKNIFEKALIKRLISGSLLFLILYISFYKGTKFIIAITVISCIFILKEWFSISYKNKNIFYIGIVFLALSISAFICLIISKGEQITFNFLCLIFANDIGAYVFGSLLKGPKLAPKISPNKTLSGFIGGVLSGVFLRFFDPMTSIFIGISAHLGDLLESYAKRLLNVKDSSGLIPGHGGILDRVDSILGASIVALLIL